ncbi:protein kinase [Candidatus Woesearchaeota archaeon]|nr:protein kinase [Candidatus Woesearchaeota archaeon]
MDWEECLAGIKEDIHKKSLGEIITSLRTDYFDLEETPEHIAEAIANFKEPEPPAPQPEEIVDIEEDEDEKPDPSYPLKNYELVPEEKEAIEATAVQAGFSVDDFRAIGTTPLDANEGEVIEAEVKDSHIVRLRIEGYSRLGTIQPVEALTRLKEGYFRRNDIGIGDPLATLEYIEKVHLSGNGMPFTDAGVMALKERRIPVDIPSAVPPPVKYKEKHIFGFEYHALEIIAKAAGVSVDDFELVDEISYHSKETDKLEVRIEGVHITGLKINRSLTEIPNDINYITHLRDLALNCNKIAKIGRMILPHLEVIDLGDNEVSDLNPLRSLFKLRVFYGFRNKISSLEGLPKSAEEVYVGGNRIRDLRRLFSGDSLHARIELDNLKFLDVVDNPIPGNDQSIAKLKERGVDVKHNKRQGEITNDTKIGDYTIEELISNEGIYHLYRAKDKSDNPCTIKIKSMKTGALSACEDKIMMDYFKGLLDIDHPNIIKFSNVGHGGSRVIGPYLVMEPIDASRYKRIEKKAYSKEEAASIVAQIASALSHIHKNRKRIGFIYPDNIFYDEETGTVKLADSADIELTYDQSGYDADKRPNLHADVSDSLTYSPDSMRQSLKMEITKAQSDVRALGLIFYDLLTGFKREAIHLPSNEEIKKIGLSKDLTRILQNMLTFDEEEIPEPEDLVGQLKETLEKEPAFSRFYALHDALTKSLSYSRQGIDQTEWPDNIAQVHKDLFSLQEYVKENRLVGYFCSELGELEQAYDKRRSADMDKIEEFAVEYEDRETAIKKGVSPEAIDDVLLNVHRLWDVLGFMYRLFKYESREEAEKNGMSGREIDSKIKIYDEIGGKYGL